MDVAVVLEMQGKKGVWIELPIGLSSLVDPAVKVDCCISLKHVMELI